jgi:hypothetical protein
MPELHRSLGRFFEGQGLVALSVLVLGLGLASTAADAQSVVLRVRVTDSTNTPVAGAELSVVRGLKGVLASVVTDSGGRRTLTVRLDSGSYQLVSRRIGYSRDSRFFTTRGSDTLSLTLRMSRLPQELATVKVTAEEDIKHKRLFIDADAIANSPRPIFDATDVIKKLRPDMRAGLSGSCPSIQEVWVNGRRIYREFVPIDAMALARTVGTNLHGTGRTRMDARDHIADHVITVLASLQAEHIAEMSYHDCADMSLGKIGGENAVFVVLKPGIAFEPGRGSYVVSAIPGMRSANAVAPSPSIPAPVPSHRTRVLGVYDGETGSPIDSCRVVDTASGTKASTTSSGTVSLAFLPEGVSTVHVEKAGYRSLTLSVTISPRDTVPITVVLSRR